MRFLANRRSVHVHPLLNAARGDADDEGEQYEVDFFRKAWMDGDGGRTSRPRLEQPVDTAGLAVSGTGAHMLHMRMKRVSHAGLHRLSSVCAACMHM